MPYEDISISLIAQEAGVGRPTFYRQYRDVNAMLIERLKADLDAQYAVAERLRAEGRNVHDTLVAISEMMLGSIAAEPQLYTPLFNGGAGANSLTIFRDQIDRLLALMPYPRSALRGRSVALTVGMLAGGISGFILSWIESGMTYSPREAAEIMTEMVVPSMPQLFG